MRECPECHKAIEDAARFCPHCGSAATDEGPDPWVGQVVNGKFRVEALVGQGGMGRVYRARHLTLDRPVVLKMLHKAYSSDPQVVGRFQREARAASRLDHPNSIAVLDFGEAEEGTLFMAMEYLGGRDLARIVADEFPLGESRIVRIGAQILSALSEAHAHGIIHRDLKPENVMVEPRRGERDFVKVLDFGIAKIIAPGANEPKLTQAGLVCGTPEYMSPEQARGADLDARTDLYSTGVILYQMVTGELPFLSDTPVGFLTKHLSEKPIPPRMRRPDLAISPALDAVVSRALEKDPASRFSTAEEMREALLACVAPEAPVPAPAARAGSKTSGGEKAVAPKSRAALWVVLAAVAVLAAGAAAYVVMTRGSAGRGDAAPETAAAAAPSGTPTPNTTPTPTPIPAPAPAPVPTTASTAATPTPAATETPTAQTPTATATKTPTTARTATTTATSIRTATTTTTTTTTTTKMSRKSPASADRVDRQKALALMRRADARRAEQDVNAAIRLYLEAEDADPGLAEIQKKLAICYQLRGDNRHAAERYRRYLATDPDDAGRVRAILSTLR